LIYHNDIPDDPARPNLKKLVNGESRLTPPLTVAQQISTAAAQGLKVTIYSKGEKSKYEVYRRVLVKKLKTGIKVWTTRDKTLKSDCRILDKSIKLVTSPITIGDHASSLENDVSQWLISETGNKFCVIDKPYHKSQTKEPAMAVCIDDATIFGHFNVIGQNKYTFMYYCAFLNNRNHILIIQNNLIICKYSLAISKCYNLDGRAPDLLPLHGEILRFLHRLIIIMQFLNHLNMSLGQMPETNLLHTIITSIKVWTTRDKTLKSDCRILGRNIKLIASPIAVNGDASSLDSDVSQWLISDPGNKFCAIDKPYHKSQTKEPAMAVCIDDATIFGHFNLIAPAQNRGKALIASANPNAWQNTQDLTGPDNHAVVKSLEHVIRADAGNKFIAYNNIPPDVPKVKTKSNSKGVLMMNPNVEDEASWIVHTVPGFPKALRGYVFPPEEIQKGHLFICLTIKESKIDAIAMALRIATPLIYHNDIPEDPARPNLKKLVNECDEKETPWGGLYPNNPSKG
ncbi:Deoxyribonuclease-2-alpha, partial [Trichinella nativa]